MLNRMKILSRVSLTVFKIYFLVAGMFFSVAAISIFVQILPKSIDQNFLVDEKVLSNSVLEKIKAQTIDMVNDHIEGRGILHPSKEVILTNNHVARALCHWKDCSYIRFRSRDQLTRKWTPGKLWFVRNCSAVLDLCILSRDSSSKLPNFTFSNKKHEEFYALPKLEDISSSSKQIIRGKITRNSENNVWGETSMRAGYSGSPLFTASGEVLAIVHSVNFAADESWTTPLKIIQKFLGGYHRHFIASSGAAIHDFLNCQDQTCLEIIVKTYLSLNYDSGKRSESFWEELYGDSYSDALSEDINLRVFDFKKRQIPIEINLEVLWTATLFPSLSNYYYWDADENTRMAIILLYTRWSNKLIYSPKIRRFLESVVSNTLPDTRLGRLARNELEKMN